MRRMRSAGYAQRGALASVGRSLLQLVQWGSERIECSARIRALQRLASSDGVRPYLFRSGPSDRL